MDKKELDEGMKKADESKPEEKEKEEPKKEEPKDGGGEGGPWAPSMDWLMDSGLGYFFSNNRGLGELLLDKLGEAGVNTETAALQGLVKVLQEFSREYKELGEVLGDNISKIDGLSSDAEDLAQAIKDLVKKLGGSEETEPNLPLDGIGGDMGMDAGMPPADMGGAPMDAGAMPPPDMGAAPMDMGAGGMPPPGLGAAPMDAGMPPPDLGAAPMDMGAGAMPPPEMSMAPAGGVTPSDENIKDVRKYVLSDEQLKNVAGRIVSAYKNRKARGRFTKLSPGIIGACEKEVYRGNQG